MEEVLSGKDNDFNTAKKPMCKQGVQLFQTNINMPAS